jgi:UDP-glucose:(heptosyl)LPS alpha-1,3-glucosyltransferase
MVKEEATRFYGYPAEQIEVVPNGVPVRDFRPIAETRAMRRKILHLRDDEIAVLFVGSGWERKGLRYAVEAVTSLGGNFRLFIAGRGGGRRIDSRSVQRLGAVRDLPAVYGAADIFLLPTLYDPFSNACLEALAAGLPVITTRANGFSEIIEHRVQGSIIDPPSNVAQICDELLYWADPDRRQVARQAILDRAGQFDISVNVARTLAVLNQAARAEALSGKIRNT